MSTTTAENMEQSFVPRLITSLRRRGAMLLDQSTPHMTLRWIVFVALLGLYWLRVYYIEGYYIITYGLGIYLLNLLIGFLQPQDDVSLEGGALPVHDSDEFRPFRRRVPEFRFWWSGTKSVLLSMFLTFFSIFDIPVFWPILLLYFIVLFTITMRRQINHMLKYKYLPWSWGKKRYDHKDRVKKREPVAPMPKVRPPIRAMPTTSTLKKINRD